MAGPSGTTPRLKLPFPTPDDNVDVPRDIQALAMGIDAAGMGLVPIGAMMQWLTDTPPTSWLICDGSAIPSICTELIALLGATLPDLRGRVAVGRNVADTDFDGMLERGGEKAHTLTAAESGTNGNGVTVNGGAHIHYSHMAQIDSASSPANWTTMAGAVSARVWDTYAYIYNTSSEHQHVLSSRNADVGHNNLQPYIVVNHIVYSGH